LKRPGAVLVAVGGLVASGKSTVARRLAEELGARLLCADELRQALHQAGHTDAYLPGFSLRVYQEIMRRARSEIERGSPVVLDGTFRSRRLRAEARALARERAVPFRFVECRAAHEVCRARLRRREEESGESGWTELFEHFLPLWEPAEEIPEAEHVVLDTSGPLQLAALEAVLHLEES
jgi:predicted kinase